MVAMDGKMRARAHKLKHIRAGRVRLHVWVPDTQAARAALKKLETKLNVNE